MPTLPDEFATISVRWSGAHEGDVLLAEAWVSIISYPTATRDSDIAARLHPGMLVVLQSTCPPGTTREVMLPVLQRTGLEVGKDYFLVFAPERIDPQHLRLVAHQERDGAGPSDDDHLANVVSVQRNPFSEICLFLIKRQRRALCS